MEIELNIQYYQVIWTFTGANWKVNRIWSILNTQYSTFIPDIEFNVLVNTWTNNNK